MSKANGKPRGRPPRKYMNGKNIAPTEHDAAAPYSRAQLLRYDNRFRARLLRAFERGLENRESAAGSEPRSDPLAEPFLLSDVVVTRLMTQGGHPGLSAAAFRLVNQIIERASSSAGVNCGFLTRRFLAGFSSLRPSRLRTNSVHS